MGTKVEASGLPCAKATTCKRHSRLIFDGESITPSGKSNVQTASKYHETVVTTGMAGSEVASGN